MSNAFTYDNRKHTLKLAKMSEPPGYPVVAHAEEECCC